MKKFLLFVLIVVILGAGAYFSGINLSFLGLRSAVLGEDCTSTQLAANKAEYDKSVSDLAILNSYITLNTCEINGQLATLGKTNFQITACQRKITLRNNKQTFINGYNTCQASINAGPRILSGAVVNDAGSTFRTLIEQEDGENTHLNESVYNLSMRAQGESYVRELIYELSLPVVNNEVGVTITKAELSSTKAGIYACAQTLSPTQTDVTKRVFLITCRATDGGYQMGVNGDNSAFTAALNLSVSVITGTGEGTLKFISGKYSLLPAGGTESPLTRLYGITQGTLKYVLAYVDPRDLTVTLDAQSNTSSTTIPVRAVFNKLIDISSVTSDDFVLSDNVTSSNLSCTNSTDNDNGLRTICTLDLEPTNPNSAADITIDFPAAAAKDRTRGTPKTNSAATQKIVHYVYGAPKIFIGAPCTTESANCSGLDNTPQLIVKAAVGDIPAGSVVSIYGNNSCGGTALHSLSATRDMPKIDLYEKTSLTNNESKTYSAKIGNSCSSLGTSANRLASYTYTGPTIAQVDRLSCMSTTTFQYTKFSVGPFVASTGTLCDAGDMVAAEKCNAWQGNATFNPECFPTGQGKLNNPYRVCTPEQLQEMDNAPYDKNHFRLGKTIDLTNSGSWFGGTGFHPIGQNSHIGFFGSLDGNGFEIQNLRLTSTDDYIGLFGSANGASFPGFWVNNLKLNNTRITSPGNNSGTLAGYAGCAIISGVESTGINMTGVKNNAGGLLGSTYLETKILYSKAQGTLATSDGSFVASAIGGMVGANPGSRLEIGQSESSVAITAKASGIGGLVGHMYGGPATANYLNIHDDVIKGSIRAKDGSSNVGGVLGNASYTRAENVTTNQGNNKITIEGNGTVAYVGGFVGAAGYSEFVHNSTSYSIQGNTGGGVGGFGGSIGTSTVSKNKSSGPIGGENSKGPRGLYIGGFVGSANGGSFTDNYTTSEVYLSQDAPAAYLGGFAGVVGGSTVKRNYATGSLQLNHSGDYDGGGFVGYIAESGGLPFTLADNFSTGNYVDNAGLYGSLPDYFGGLVGLAYKTATDTVENNHFYNTAVSTCTGAASPNKPTCTSVASDSVFQSPSHAVYTRASNTWDFTNTWRSVAGGLPELR